jgi:LAO/AO transport system kinase
MSAAPIRANPIGYRPSVELIPKIIEGAWPEIARMISRAEAGYEEAIPALSELYKRAGKAHVIGITGVPGAGKSALVSGLIKSFSAPGCRVAVIAVDPSSPFSGGSILGDRLRMSDSAHANRAFVRSMATRGHLGGLASTTLQAVDILDAAGFSPIIVETVGVGQDEVEIVTAAHTVVVLSAPGLGDDIQAIKAGVMEIADIHVVSKADKPEAAATVAAIKGMLVLGSDVNKSFWTTPVLTTSSKTGEGLAGLTSAINEHWSHLKASGEFEIRERHICRKRVLATMDFLVRRRFDEGAQEMAQTFERVVSRELDPVSAAVALLDLNNEH